MRTQRDIRENWKILGKERVKTDANGLDLEWKLSWPRTSQVREF